MITLEKVSFTYRSGQRALQDVDLNIEGGDFIAIMGENGAGKTTLAKHLNGLLKPSQGRSWWTGMIRGRLAWPDCRGR